MKCALTFTYVLAAFAVIGSSTAVKGPGNPVSRVVGLLQGLAAKIEKEGKTEEDLYEDFVCWGKSYISTTEASNAEARSKIEELNTYIENLRAGRIELTTERVDLEKEIKELSEDKESASAQRDSEHSEFLLAEDEMKKAVAALESAVQVLDDATKNSKEGTLLSVRSQVNGGMAALMEESADLTRAVELGKRFLSQADAYFLSHLLSGQVPNVDWKKINRKATFKMKYKARSFKIQDILAKMLKTFQTNLAAAQGKEKAAQDTFDKLKETKDAQLTSAQEALVKMEKEGGAKNLSESEATDLLESLQKQVSDDEGFIKQTENDLAIKKDEWKVRQQMRAGELAAISEAIKILHNDDTRDLMKKSFESQGYSFLQREAATQSRSRAGMLFRNTAHSTGDQRLLSLSAALRNTSAPLANTSENLGMVITMIDKLLVELKQEEADDLAMKEDCEKTRAEDLRSAVLASRSIDETTDAITQLQEDIKNLEKEVDDTNKTKIKTEQALKEATDMRTAEHKQFLLTDADDLEALQTVQSAHDVLETFYKDNNLMLMQRSAIAGEQPTPPPETWDGAYMGATSESTGILAVMQMIIEDIEKDKAKAKSTEDTAEQEYQTFKSDSDEAIGTYNTRISSLQGTIAGKASDIEQKKGERAGEKATLDVTIKKIKDNAKPPGVGTVGCDYYTTAYAVRVKNRQVEIDGLTKGKAMLQGGEFTAPDPNREIKPGDALLQVAIARRTPYI
mmetsp:Transcript_87652/g.151855  ORF Transcript_87652/g.151855 Transcript_87652/m.151855 type:complete len:738 (+) Transcript_87652:62-2275(+)